jgi:hypothetical protein
LNRLVKSAAGGALAPTDRPSLSLRLSAKRGIVKGLMPTAMVRVETAGNTGFL